MLCNYMPGTKKKPLGPCINIEASRQRISDSDVLNGGRIGEEREKDRGGKEGYGGEGGDLPAAPSLRNVPCSSSRRTEAKRRSAEMR